MARGGDAGDALGVFLLYVSQLAAIETYLAAAARALDVFGPRKWTLEGPVWLLAVASKDSGAFGLVVDWTSVLLLGLTNFSLPLALDEALGYPKLKRSSSSDLLLLGAAAAPRSRSRAASRVAFVAATAAFVASGAAVAFPIAPLFVCVLATSCAAVAVALLWVPVIRPALKMFKAVAAFSKPLAAASFFLVLSGAVRAPTIELCAQAAWVYVLTFVQAKQFLYQYDARQDAAAWAQFTAEHRWALFGFGLPSWAATQYVHPLAGLLLLEANQGAAATFLAEALAGSVD
ncbi:hypothetical protein SO694_0035902 [Aureococcus anophagefferens]|uniref:GPI ethanolamine phosphate transferase 1 n=1 Tax=Aureococcus anophagefferens TaxID=44056 RepID=A0ABR1FFK5_AURAN